MAKKREDSIIFLPERVDIAKRRTDITNKRISEVIEVSEKHISEVFNGRAGVSFGLARKIAKLLGTTISFLIGEDDNDEKVIPLPASNKVIPLDNLTWIPVISPEVKVSAGVGNCCEEVVWEKIDEFPLFDGKIAALYSDNGLLSLYVEGDSMEPQIHDGDLVIFKKTDEWVPGNVVVACLDGRLMVKGILKGPEGETRLRSLNRNYEDIIIGRGSFFLVYGRVIKIVRQWDPKPVV